MPDLLHPAEGPDTQDSDAEPEAGLDGGGDFVVVATADDQIEADLLRRACEDAGIPALVRAPRDGMVGKLSAPAESLSILVRTADVERARVLIAEHKEALAADPEGGSRAAEQAEEEEAKEEAAKMI